MGQVETQGHQGPITAVDTHSAFGQVTSIFKWFRFIGLLHESSVTVIQ